MPDFGYIGGCPDKDPIYIKVLVEETLIELTVPVSRYLMMSVFKSLIFGKLNLLIKDYDIMNDKDEKIGPGLTFHSIDANEHTVLRIVKSGS